MSSPSQSVCEPGGLFIYSVTSSNGDIFGWYDGLWLM